MRNQLAGEVYRPVLGAMTALALVPVAFLISSGCNRGDSQADKSQRYQVNNDLSADRLDTRFPESTSQTDGIAFEKDVSKLVSLSTMLSSRADKIPFDVMVKDLGLQQQIAERLFELELTTDQRRFATDTAVAAMLKLHSMSDLKARERLLKFVERLRDDSDREVRRAVLTALAVVRVDDFLRIEGSEFDVCQEIIRGLLEEFGDSKALANAMQKIVLELMLRDEREIAISVMNQMANRFRLSDDEEIRRVAAIMEDRVHIAEIKFDKVAREMQKGVPGAKEEFLVLIKRLAGKESVGPELYHEILAAEGWLEQIDQYDDARKILSMLQSNAPNYVEEIRQRVKVDSQAALKRLNLLDRPLNIIGQNLAGEKLESADSKGKVVVLAFWSATKPDSVLALQRLTQVYRRFKDRGLEIYGVCIDDKMSQSSTVFGNRKPPWPTIYKAPSDESKLSISQTGVYFVPYLITLNRKGVVTDINTPLIEVPEQVEKLLREPTLPLENEPATVSPSDDE